VHKCAPNSPLSRYEVIFDPFFDVFWTPFFLVFLKKVKKNQKKTGSNVRPLFLTFKKKVRFFIIFLKNRGPFWGFLRGGGSVLSILSKNARHCLKNRLLPVSPPRFLKRG
jgi:hypothetical protein